MSELLTWQRMHGKRRFELLSYGEKSVIFYGQDRVAEVYDRFDCNSDQMLARIICETLNTELDKLENTNNQ